MDKFDGFPKGMRNIPIPAALLSSLLEEMNDIAEIRCTLRFFWHIAQIRGYGRSVSSHVLFSDEILIRSLGSSSEIQRGLDLAVKRKTLVVIEGDTEPSQYFINDLDGRRAVQSHSEGHKRIENLNIDQNLQPNVNRPNIFDLYESNIGILTPIISEELRDAETIYPLEWIELAIIESVKNNARSWRYISRVLEHWYRKGKNVGADGKPGRNTETLTATEYRRRSI